MPLNKETKPDNTEALTGEIYGWIDTTHANVFGRSILEKWTNPPAALGTLL